MSHFTHIKTQFQHLFYLEKALNQLNIVHKKKKSTDQFSNANLVISQSNGDNVEFSWNGEEYELLVDISLWKQTQSTKSFIDQIAQQYASEVIIGESKKTGFQPVKYQQNSDGSNTLVLERFKLN